MTLSPSGLEGLWLGHDVRPETARPLASWPLIVLVGVTGVGKSTALAALNGPTLGGPGLRVLPDRRQVTDAVMIWPQAGRAVSDREERFKLTAQYRETHPGGMAQALGELWAEPLAAQPLVFDGLRGLNEVQYAAEVFAAWRFINLHAPDALRVRRLLGRGDAFDNAGGTVGGGVDGDLRAALAALPGAAQVLTPGELGDLAALTADRVTSPRTFSPKPGLCSASAGTTTRPPPALFC